MKGSFSQKVAARSHDAVLKLLIFWVPSRLAIKQYWARIPATSLEVVIVGPDSRRDDAEVVEGMAGKLKEAKERSNQSFYIEGT